ncbi:MAG: diacylglycerol kinase family lipid kinase [Gemmatimonadota bacterium]|jgi:YegS/Rv2252/BmrU family lipid kinase
MSQTSNPITVILNPTASGGTGSALRAPLERKLSDGKMRFDLRLTEGPGHATELAHQAARDGAEKILAVGGDGTVHEVANGVLEAGVPTPALAVLPVGTGNDFFRMIGPNKGPDGALDLLRNGEVRWFDVGRVRLRSGTRFFVNLLGVGIDVEILRRRGRFQRLRGLSQYLAALASALTTFRPVPFRVSFKTNESPVAFQVVEERTILAALTVGPSVGGGFLLNPDASPYDGLLDLFFVRTLGILKIARCIPKVLRGSRLEVPEVLQKTVTEAVIERSDGEPFFFEMDGECMPEPEPSLEIDVCSSKLPVLVPGGDPCEP